MTTPIYPPIPVQETGSPSPSVTVIEQTNVFQIGEYQLEVLIDDVDPLKRTIAMSLKNAAGELLIGQMVAGIAWVILDDSTGVPSGSDVFKSSPIFLDAPGGSEWDIIFEDGVCELVLERAATELDFYLAVRILGVITCYAFTIGS
jgi:hypothetical protein